LKGKKKIIQKTKEFEIKVLFLIRIQKEIPLMNTYLFYSKLLQEISSNRCNYKSMILNKCQAKGFSPSQIKRTYAIILNSHKNLSSLQQILHNFTSNFPQVKIGNSWLFLVLLHEFFREQTPETPQKSLLKGGGYLIRMVKKHQDFLRNEISSLKTPLFTKSLVKESVYLRYISKKTTLSALSEEISQKTGQKAKILIDPEIPNLISIDYEVYSKVFCEEGPVSDRKDIIIQGKSSCFPAWVLFRNLLTKKEKFQKKRFDVIDACAAPGNKTLQISEYLSDFPKANFFVYEKNQIRFQLLESRLNNYAINQEKTKVFNADFLLTDPFSSEFSHVRLLLLDPSCSGSGMRIHLFLNENSEEKNRNFEEECLRKYRELKSKELERVKKLKEFQTKILLHAMKFSKVIRICYSTCSIYDEENEKVVEKVLKIQKDFTLVNLKNKFKGLESGFGPLGKKCIRANPFADKTDGFFIALFKRKIAKLL